MGREHGMNDVRGGADITMMWSGGAASTKWTEGMGDVLSLTCTIWTVYAGPHNLILESSREGEIIAISGMWQLVFPSLTRASETSHEEKSERLSDMSY